MNIITKWVLLVIAILIALYFFAYLLFENINDFAEAAKQMRK